MAVLQHQQNDNTGKTCTVTTTAYTAPDETGTTTEYKIVISGDTVIEACAETFPTYGIYGINRTGITHTDTSKDTEWDDWSSGTLLLPTNYTKTMSPTAVTKNTTNSTKTYTITATGKTGTVYSGVISNTFTMTQAANCVVGGKHINNLTINFPTEYGGRVGFTVKVNGTDITDTVVASTSLNYYKLGSIYEFSKPSASTIAPYNSIPLSFNTNDGDSVEVTCNANGGYLDTYGGNFITSTIQTSNLGTYTSTENRNMSITMISTDVPSGGDSEREIPIAIRITFPLYGGYVFGFEILKNGSRVTPDFSTTGITYTGTTIRSTKNTFNATFKAKVGDVINVSYTNGGAFEEEVATHYVAATCPCAPGGCENGTYCLSHSGIVESGDITVTSNQGGGSITISTVSSDGGGGLIPLPIG